MHTILEDYALISPLRYKNAELKVLLALSSIIIGVMSTSPVTPIIISLFFGLAIIYLGKVPAKIYLKLLLIPGTFLIFGILIILFFFGTGPDIISFNILDYKLSITTGGLDMAVLVFSRSISGLSCLYFLSLSTPITHLFYVLKELKLPEIFIELSMLIYRYIFVFLDLAMKMEDAQNMRMGYTSFRNWMYSLAMLASTLFIRTWEQGEKLYIAMNSRCYDGKISIFKDTNPISLSEAVVSISYLLFIIILTYTTRNLGIEVIL